MDARAMHFVGSLPPESNTGPEDGMRWILGRAADYPLTGLPNDDDPRWIIAWLENLRHVTAEPSQGDGSMPVFETINDGDSTDYDRMPCYRIRDGATLLPRHVTTGQAERVRAKLPTFRALRDEYNRPGLRHQVSIPAPLDSALFALANPSAVHGKQRIAGVLAALRHQRVFTAAVYQEVGSLVHDGDGTDAGDLVFQLETPLVLCLLWQLPPAARPAAAQWLARNLARTLAGWPRHARLSLHLCYGDLEHRSLVRPDSLAPAVLFLNALGRQLRKQGTPLPPVHLPAAFGDQPPPSDPGPYAPLAKLHPDWQLYAGVVDPQAPRASATALSLFEAAAGRRAAAVGAACGLGRHTPDTAHQAAELMATLTAPISPTSQ